MPRYSFVDKIANDAKADSLPFSGFVAPGQQRQGVLALLLQRRLLLLVEGGSREEAPLTREIEAKDSSHCLTCQTACLRQRGTTGWPKWSWKSFSYSIVSV